nr:hypothetical protein [Tanacetum cinerariifolium]
APTEGYEDAIVVPAITADNFELKHGLLTLVQNKQFYGHDKEDPRAHICYFNKITSTLKFPNIPNTLRNEITNFQQPAYQAPAYQAPAPQTQGILKEDFSAYVKANDAVMKNMQTQALIENKEKLSEMTRTLLNEHCSAVLLKKLPEKLGDPGKFLIPCDFSELADHSISRPVGVAKDVYVKVGSFHFLADFVVVDFDADPRAPLILRGSFLKSKRALIDIFKGELTLRVGKEAITFNLDQTSRYYANYSDMMAKRIDVIDMACEEYSQEVLGFFDTISSGNPTLYYDLIVSTTSLTLTLLGNKGDILLSKAFLNDDLSLPPLNQRNYLPEVRKELKIYEAKSEKSLVDEPLVVELKVLPPHLEYAFLEGEDCSFNGFEVPQATIAWKLSDIKGINPEFCTHKILMEEDFEPTVQY